MKLISRSFSFLFILLLAATFSQASSFEGVCVKVLDGDTIEVLKPDKQLVRVRLANIDTPEKDQPSGNAAKRFTLEVAAQKKVRVEVKTKDRYGRSIGVVYLPDGSQLNKELVRSGYAWVYTRYNDDPSLVEIEQKTDRYFSSSFEKKAAFPWKGHPQHLHQLCKPYRLIKESFPSAGHFE